MSLVDKIAAMAETIGADVRELKSDKVDKVSGKGLSDTNFTQVEKTKLTGIESGATKNRADTLNADKSHTHTTAQVTGLDTALSGKAATTDPRFTDAREWTGATIAQAEAEAGTATTRRAWTAQRVRQAIVAWFNGISGALGRTILTRTTAEQVRSDIGLGTAATKNVGSNIGDVLTVNSSALGIQTSSDFVNGTLIRTEIPASAKNGASFLLTIGGKAFNSSLPHHIALEGYIYNNTFINVRGVNFSGGGITNITILEDGGMLCFWFARTGYWNSFNISVVDTRGTDMRNRALVVEDVVKPTSTKLVEATLVTTWNSSNQLNIGTTADSAKAALGLGAIAAGATKNATDAQLRARSSHTGTQAVSTITGLGNVATRNVGTTANTIMAGDDSRVVANTSKLSGIATGATKNATDAYLLNRVNHTGMQPTSTITGLDAELLTKVVKEAGKGLSTNDYTTAEKNKLGTIAASATANSTDAALRARSSHTGTQATSTIVGLDTALGNKVDKVAGKGLSSTDFTQAEKNKLASLESSKFVGLFVSESALPSSGNVGDYANVDGGVGSDVYRVIWDSSDKKWVRVQGVTGELTPAQIKQQYESNPDTNAYTDAQKTKLAGITSGATKNATDAQLRARSSHTGTQAISTVVGLQAGLDSKVDKVAGKGLSANDFTDVLKTKVDSLPSGVGGLIPLSAGGTGATSAATARTALQLGNTVTHNYGTAANTVMMGNDSRANNGQAAFNRLNIGATAATARTALELGTAAVKDEAYFALRAGTASQDFTTKEVGTVAANIRATTGSEGVKMEYNHTTKSLDFNFYQ